MIVDKISKLELYSTMTPFLRPIAKYIQNGCWDDGKKLVSTGISCTVSQYDTHEKGLNGYEIHKKYADVQIILEGEEIIDIGDEESMVERSPFDTEKDIGFFDGKLLPLFKQRLVTFFVFYPGEYHEPCLSVSDCSHIKKAVFKVYID